MKKYKFILEKTDTGYSSFEESAAIYTTGKTIEEVQDNALEATNLYLEDDAIQLSKNDLEFQIDFKQFFEYYKIINAKHLASRIGMNESLLSQYVNGKKHPSKKQIDKIVKGLNSIGKELMEISLT